jgi:hypothetical protein
MKEPTIPTPTVKISNTKHPARKTAGKQIANKSQIQYSMTKTGLRLRI